MPKKPADTAHDASAGGPPENTFGEMFASAQRRHLEHHLNSYGADSRVELPIDWKKLFEEIPEFAHTQDVDKKRLRTLLEQLEDTYVRIAHAADNVIIDENIPQSLRNKKDAGLRDIGSFLLGKNVGGIDRILGIIEEEFHDAAEQTRVQWAEQGNRPDTLVSNPELDITAKAANIPKWLTDL